jgi:Zn-dependent peptidase ImmA (M78 family)
MVRTCANINKETLCYICSQIGVSATFLSQKTGVSEEKVNEWLDASNNTFPTFNQAKSLAKILKIPFAGLYMIKDKLPINQLPSLRNLRTLPDSRPIDDSSLNLAVAELIRYRDFLLSSETEMEIETKQLSLPTLSEGTGIADYAKTIRSYFGLELETQFKLQSARQFYLYVRQQIENRGVFIHCFTGVDVEIIRGISIYNETAPIIGLNDNDRYPAKTFSIIHELVHILKHQSTLCNDMFSSFSAQNEEVFCNAVVGEALVPAASLNAYLSANKITNISLDEIDTMAKRFCISKEVVVRRLLDTDRFSKDEYDTFANEIRQTFVQEREAEKIARQEGRGQQIPKNISREAIDKTSSAICRMLLIGYSDGHFSKQDVSGFLGIKEKHIPKFFAEVAKW